jgi:hypothetical protein
VGVVEQDQRASPGQQRAIERRLLVDGDGHPHRMHAQRPQKPHECVAGLDQVPGGVRSAEVQVELAVRKATDVLVPPMNGQCCLSHAAGAADDGRGQAVLLEFGEAGESVHVGLAADKTGHRWGQLARSSRRPGERLGPGRPWCRWCGPCSPQLFRAVARGREGAELLAGCAEQVDEVVEAVGRRQGRAGEVLTDDRVRPSRPGRELTVRQ